MRIEWLINNTYQVVDEDGTVWFQGSMSDCSAYIAYKSVGSIRAGL